MQNIKLPYQKHVEEEDDTSPHNGEYVNNENHETNRSSIIEDTQKKMETQFNQSYMITYTQGNMTTNSNNLSVSKVDLNQIQGRYKSVNKQSSEMQEYTLDPNDLQNNEELKDGDTHIIPLEIQQELNNYHSSKVGIKGNHSSSSGSSNNNNVFKGEDHRAAKKNNSNKQPAYKKRQGDLQIEIPNSDEERKARQAAYNKMIQQQQQIMQSNGNNTNNNNNNNKNNNNQGKSKNSEKGQYQQKELLSSDKRPDGTENQESARVNDIIRNNQIDVENLETIQIDYDFETIEGLTDDQCLELYCEGSVKLKNQSRLYCKLAYEHLLVDKIRATTRLVYTNLGIINNGNLNSSDFIADYIVAPLKRENSKFRTQDISEAFTVQCSDYIHFNIKKLINRAVKLFIFLTLAMLICFILKIQDPAYETDVALQSCFIILGLIQFASTYFYISGIYACSNDYIRRALFFSNIYFVGNIVQLLFEGISLGYIKQIGNNTLKNRDNFKQSIFYFFCFIVSLIIPPYIYKLNKNTTSAVRRIVKIVSDEYID